MPPTAIRPQPHASPTVRTARSRRALCLTLGGLVVAMGQVAAQTNPADAWTAQAQSWITQQLTETEPASNPQAPRLRPEVSFGTLDPRLQLAPCAKVEPYLPQGTRLWGRSRIGLRCVEGPARWNVFLPVTVKIWGPAWVVRQTIAPGTPLSADDAEPGETDWAESAAAVLVRPGDWVGAEASHALAPGQVLRQGAVRPPRAFSAGTQVKVIVRGKGFQLSTTGEALNHGHLGQTARVRMPNRRVVSGTVRDAETVEIAQ